VWSRRESKPVSKAQHVGRHRLRLGCHCHTPANGSENAKCQSAPLVTVIQAEPLTLRLDVHSQGIVTPRNEIDLTPKVSGKIIQLHPDFVTGGFFARNDLLVTIDPRDYDYAIAQAQAQIAEDKRQLAMEEAQADVDDADHYRRHRLPRIRAFTTWSIPANRASRKSA